MPQLFHASPFPLSAGGSIAQALSDSGDLAGAAGGVGAIGDIVQSYKTKQLLNSKLSDLGYDDQHALLAGAAPQTLPGATSYGGGPGGTKTDPQPVVLPPSAMTVRQLMLRKQAAGDQANVATAPNIAQVFGGQTPPQLGAMGNVPVPVAEKLGPLLNATKQQPKVYVNATQFAKFSQTHDPKDYPAFSPAPSSADDIEVDRRLLTGFTSQAGNMMKQFLSAGLSPEEQGALQKAADNNLLSPERLGFMKPAGLKVLAKQFLANHEYNASEADYQYTETKAAARSKGNVVGGEGTRQAAAAGTVDDILNELDKTMKSLPDSSFKVFNKAYLAGASSVSDPDANKALALFMEAAKAQAKADKGGTGSPTNEDVKRAAAEIAPSLSSGGVAAVRSALDVTNKSRSKRLGGKDATGNAPGAGAKTYDQYGVNAAGQKIGWSKGMTGWEVVK